MEKPKNYDETPVFADSKILPPGGYICKIKQVNEMKSRSGKEMIAILLDIVEGDYKDFYEEKFKADTRTDKKWGCVVYQLTHDNEGNASRGFKSFNTSVEESNDGFKTVWGNDYSKVLKGKFIGGLFRREQFETTDGRKAFSTKCFAFRSVNTIKKGVEVPADKLLVDNKASNSSNKVSDSSASFYKVEDNVDDDDLPF